MNDRELEELLRSFEGPSPRRETRVRVLDAARKARLEPREVDRARFRILPFVLGLSTAALLAVAGGVWLVLQRGRIGSDIGKSPPRAVKSRRQLAIVRHAEVRVSRNGKPQALQVGDPIYANEPIVSIGQAKIRLLDGSILKLDGNTQLALRIPEAGERVRIALQSGRILLRVTESAKSFIVRASAEVEVLGTEFGMEEDGQRTSVSVYHGRVAIRSQKETLILTDGESGAAPKGQPPAITGMDPNVSLLWARDRVRFENRPLGEVLAWISANSTYTFGVKSEAQREMSVTIAIGHQPMRQVVDSLLLSCNVRYERDRQRIIIYP